MSCCCPQSKSGGRIFSFFARNYRKRFTKKGFETSQKQLIQGLEKVGFQNASLLEVGSGVGYMHQVLLEQGAKSAVGIDLATDMLKEAQAWADEKGLTDQVQYIQGDFIELLDQVDKADMTILDKVVCCYPHAELLINSSTAKTNRVYALTYPRNRWFIRAAIEVMAFFLKLSGSDFRAFVHNPNDIEAWITKVGFKKAYQDKTFIWLTQVYQK